MANQNPPVKNVAFTWRGFIRKSDGTLITSGTLTSSLCVDGGNADTSVTPAFTASGNNEVSVAITQALMNGDVITGKVESNATGAIPTTFTIYTTAAIQNVNVTQLGGDAQSATDLKDFADAGYDPATNKVEGVKLADDVTAKTGYTATASNFVAAPTVAEIWDALLTGITTVGSIGKLIKDNIDAAISTRSTYAGADTAGTATLLTRITAAIPTLTELTAAFTEVKGAGWTNETLKHIHDAESTPPTAAVIADAVWDEALSGHAVAGSAGKTLSSAATLGAGACTFTYTLTRSDTGAAIPNASVWVTTDLAGSLVIAAGTTNSSGIVTFYLDAGTVYVWREAPGYTFSNPDTEVVS